MTNGPGLPVILVGLAATTLSRAFDGVVQGLFLGAGIALLLLGAFLVGRSARPRRDADGTAEWLPSRDGSTPPPSGGSPR